MRFVIEETGKTRALEVTCHRVLIGGWSGRDEAAVRHHVAELAALGVAPPSRTPLFYRVTANLPCQAERIQVLGGNSSGEVEAVLIGSEAGTLVTVGSDHTDRDVETYSVPVAKQSCRR